jgi:2-polyprenyl-3-methyl-5-hydroxy-6-metoxy-1,4-benzoquinol methylase
MTTTSSEFEALKARLKATWMAGDFGQIAKYSEPTAEQSIARRAITPGMRVLDVACGTGNLAIPAAKAGAIVTGVVRSCFGSGGCP